MLDKMYVFLVDGEIKGYYETFEDVKNAVKLEFDEDPFRVGFTVFEVSDVFEVEPKLESVSLHDYLDSGIEEVEEEDYEVDDVDSEEKKEFKIIERKTFSEGSGTINF